MAAFKVRAKKQGGHVEVTVWMGESEGYTFANCGSLIFRLEEYAEFLVRLDPIHIEYKGFDEEDVHE